MKTFIALLILAIGLQYSPAPSSITPPPASGGGGGSGDMSNTNAAAYKAYTDTLYDSLNAALNATNDLNSTFGTRLIATNNLLVTRIQNATNDLNTTIGTRLIATNDLLVTRIQNATNDLKTAYVSADTVVSNALWAGKIAATNTANLLVNLDILNRTNRVGLSNVLRGTFADISVTGGGGSGTVTHTAGSLGATEVAIGNGGDDIKSDPAFTYIGGILSVGDASNIGHLQLWNTSGGAFGLLPSPGGSSWDNYLPGSTGVLLNSNNVAAALTGVNVSFGNLTITGTVSLTNTANQFAGSFTNVNGKANQFASYDANSNLVATLNAGSLTNLLYKNLVDPTNGTVSATFDFSIPHASTNMSGGFTITGLSNFNPTNYNVAVRELLANGADRTLTVPGEWRFGPYGGTTATVTNGTIAKLTVEMQPNIFTNAWISWAY